MNEEPPPKSSIDLTLMQHLHVEDPKPREVCPCLKVEPPRTWYYRISPKSRTLVILLKVNLVSNDEFETICESCYKTKNISNFTWSSILDLGHYRWLHGPICRLLSDSKANYLIRTIRCILDFLQL